ncbi:hypothetical protein A5893_11730 [Pedobacter psychrophilus]|uniref:Nitrogen fixation protein FixH n=1 Tax=Pedobacter psychrophilus TaxID=1826909 RepID=A0A179DEK2_9SPHI|nr:FixH family protein [Pedobacter psychrophilus]OAQ39324.1 hypothetical protein A5893_11730 [Pedobacter psychrophilus]
MNWGRSIILVLIIFMGFITILAIKMTYSIDDAFDKDYYEKGLAFDEEYALKQNVIDDHATPLITVNGNTLNVEFKALENGNILFKRTADKTKDRSIKLKNSSFSIDKGLLEKGQWHLVISWNNGKRNYLYEKNIYIP